MIPIRNYITAGKSTFTVVSGKTGNRFTFRVNAPRERKADFPLFVKVRTGGDQNWLYVGTVFGNDCFRTTRKSAVSEDAPEVKAFTWLWRNADDLAGKVEFLPSGNCCRCGRQLTTPESIAAGIGPECAGKC